MSHIIIFQNNVHKIITIKINDGTMMIWMVFRFNWQKIMALAAVATIVASLHFFRFIHWEVSKPLWPCHNLAINLKWQNCENSWMKFGQLIFCVRIPHGSLSQLKIPTTETHLLIFNVSRSKTRKGFLHW